jgi:hypothetical protein
LTGGAAQKIVLLCSRKAPRGNYVFGLGQRDEPEEAAR